MKLLLLLLCVIQAPLSYHAAPFPIISLSNHKNIDTQRQKNDINNT